MLERLQRMPVPVLPTFVGALTLSNVYNSMGYPWIRHLTMWAATAILLLYIVKIIRYPSVCWGEYQTTVPCSLYAGFTMILMILGSYYFDYVPALGKAMWGAAIAIHAVHILIFTVRNVIRKRDINTTVPSWFVTYNGIMVSCVVGGAMNANGVLTVIVYYGIIIYPGVPHHGRASGALQSVRGELPQCDPESRAGAAVSALSLRPVLPGVHPYQTAEVLLLPLCPGLCGTDVPHVHRDCGHHKDGGLSDCPGK